jgi:hypothetical protein
MLEDNVLELELSEFIRGNDMDYASKYFEVQTLKKKYARKIKDETELYKKVKEEFENKTEMKKKYFFGTVIKEEKEKRRLNDNYFFDKKPLYLKYLLDIIQRLSPRNKTGKVSDRELKQALDSGVIRIKNKELFEKLFNYYTKNSLFSHSYFSVNYRQEDLKSIKKEVEENYGSKCQIKIKVVQIFDKSLIRLFNLYYRIKPF